MEHKPTIAVAVYMTDNNDLYSLDLYSEREVDLAKDGTHPEIDDRYKLIIVHGDLTTTDCT